MSKAAIPCPNCEKRFKADSSLAGKKTRCSYCKKIFTVPASAFDDEEVAVVEEVSESRRPARATSRRDEDDDDEDEDDRDEKVSASRRPVKAAARRGREEDEEEEDDPREKKSGSAVPWLVGGGVACFGLLVAGVVAAVVLTRGGKNDDNKQAVVNPPIQQPNPNPNPNPNPVPNPIPNPNPVVQDPPDDRDKGKVKDVGKEKDPPQDKTRRGELSREARDAVKHATVFLVVTMANGSVASGSGFFGVPEAPTVILTNAHVVGMLDANSPRPRRIDVIVHSGQDNEKRLLGTVAAVDRHSDLAVVLLAGQGALPRPITCKEASGVGELDKVFVFGFPFGRALSEDKNRNPEITIRDTTVSALRKKGGALERIQTAGGMDPGNSGGPVVDDQGHVVGVAVSGIPGRAINFAIPGDRVADIIKGRITAMGTGPYPFRSAQTGDGLGLPVRIEMIDPLGKVKEVGMDVWVGDPGRSRPPADDTPQAVNGDSQRQRTTLIYVAGRAHGDVMLPALPNGKVYWIQPTWSYVDGRRRWAGAAVHVPGGTVIDRKAVMLAVRYDQTGLAGRKLEVSLSNRMRVSSSDETDVVALRNELVFTERAKGLATAKGVQLRQSYESAKMFVSDDRRKDQLSRSYEEKVGSKVKGLANVVDLDPKGELLRSGVDLSPQLKQQFQLKQKETEKVIRQHNEMVQPGLGALYLALPGKNLSPQDAWKQSRKLTVLMPLEDEAIQKVTLDLVCTYQGVINPGTDKETAIVEISGQASDRDASLTGPVTGRMLVNVKTGTVELVQLDATVEMAAIALSLDGKMQKVRCLSTLGLRLKAQLSRPLTPIRGKKPAAHRENERGYVA